MAQKKTAQDAPPTVSTLASGTLVQGFNPWAAFMARHLPQQPMATAVSADNPATPPRLRGK